MATPIALGVQGEASEIVNDSGGGICFEPENGRALADCVTKLAHHPEQRATMGDDALSYVTKYFDRSVLAERYLEELDKVIDEH